MKNLGLEIEAWYNRKEVSEDLFKSYQAKASGSANMRVSRIAKAMDSSIWPSCEVLCVPPKWFFSIDHRTLFSCTSWVWEKNIYFIQQTFVELSTVVRHWPYSGKVSSFLEDKSGGLWDLAAFSKKIHDMEESEKSFLTKNFEHWKGEGKDHYEFCFLKLLSVNFHF